MDKKLCITVCPNGALITREQNPNQPYTPREIAQQAIAAYKEGAVMLHFHARDEQGYNIPSDARPYIEAIELVLSECPDMIMCPSISIQPKKTGAGLYEVETVQEVVDALLKRGRRFIETTVITPVSYVSPRPIHPREKEAPKTIVTPEKLQAEAKFIQDKGIKPEFMAHNFEAIENVKEYLTETDILKKPYFISMGPGMHKPSPKTYPDPWGMIYLINMKENMPPYTVIGTSIGGRNWLPITILAIMLGVDFIRVGMEDSIWLYPHKDEKIKSCAQVTSKIAIIAKELGRELATPDEAREILSIKKQG